MFGNTHAGLEKPVCVRVSGPEARGEDPNPRARARRAPGRQSCRILTNAPTYFTTNETSRNSPEEEVGWFSRLHPPRNHFTPSVGPVYRLMVHWVRDGSTSRSADSAPVGISRDGRHLWPAGRDEAAQIGTHPHCCYNIDVALMELPCGVDAGAARRGPICVKAGLSVSTTQFGSAANTLLFVFMHYPPMPRHRRERPEQV